MFKKIVTLIVILCLLLCTVGCGTTKVIDGKEHETYGILNEDRIKNPDVEYSVCWGNVFWGVVLFQTIIAPIYFFGFSLFEPEGKKVDIDKSKFRKQRK